MSPASRVVVALVCVASCAIARTVHAQDAASHHVYVVRSGDTLTRVASRLQVPAAAVIQRNNLHAPFALRIGRRLRLPPGVPAEVYRDLPLRDGDTASLGHGAHASRARHRDDAADQPERPGWVTLVRHRDDAEATFNFRESMSTLHTRLERFFRYRDGSRHVVHPRLVRNLAALSDHFGGRTVVLLSAFRPQLGHATGPRTRHSQGFAVDVRVEGIAARTLFEYCQTLTDVGCGFYPHANFVHIDVRRESAAWTDEAQPGTRRAQDVRHDADESVAEVLADAAIDPRH